MRASTGVVLASAITVVVGFNGFGATIRRHEARSSAGRGAGPHFARSGPRRPFSTGAPSTTSRRLHGAVDPNPVRSAARALAAAAPTCVAALAGGLIAFAPTAATAAVLDEEQQLIAEAWRVVDKSFSDRTFNGVDWWTLRQTKMKARHSSLDAARVDVADMLGQLGDPYTRYLSPSKCVLCPRSAAAAALRCRPLTPPPSHPSSLPGTPTWSTRPPAA